MSRLGARPLIAAPLVMLAALALPRGAAAQQFSYLPAGELLPGSGEGRADEIVYAPAMRFPLEEGPAFANSQVYNKGGISGPSGAQCDASNYAYPWRDNFCETRSWSMPLCPAGTGHQGQDIRPPTCEAGKYWVVAVADGTITSVGSYSVYLTQDDGTQYEYLHMSNVQVAPGQVVMKGEHVGRVANVFGATPTTIHLHFNLRQLVNGIGTVYVPPYTSLVAAYRSLLNVPAKGALEAADCGGIKGWTEDPDSQSAPSTARLTFDGAITDLNVEGYSVPAATHRDDLCAELGSCEHGFETPLPLSLLGGEHVVHAYGIDTLDGEGIELDGSPKAFTCALVVPDGVRRQVLDATNLDSWRFSRFWDVAKAPDATIKALPQGEVFPGAPRLVRSSDVEEGAPVAWLLDGTKRRPVPNAQAASAWELDLDAAETWPAAKLDAVPIGLPLPARPFLLQGSGPEVVVIDTAPPPSAGAGGGGEGSTDPATGAGTGAPQGDARCDASAGGAGQPGTPWPFFGLLAAALGTAARRAGANGNLIGARRLAATAHRSRAQ